MTGAGAALGAVADAALAAVGVGGGGKVATLCVGVAETSGPRVGNSATKSGVAVWMVGHAVGETVAARSVGLGDAAGVSDGAAVSEGGGEVADAALTVVGGASVGSSGPVGAGRVQPARPAAVTAVSPAIASPCHILGQPIIGRIVTPGPH
jgi:hypothetical protein